MLYVPPISLKILHWQCDRFSSYSVFPISTIVPLLHYQYHYIIAPISVPLYQCSNISTIVSLLQTHICFIFHQRNLASRTVNFFKCIFFISPSFIIQVKCKFSNRMGKILSIVEIFPTIR